jgi:hypothetical protein
MLKACTRRSGFVLVHVASPHRRIVALRAQALLLGFLAVLLYLRPFSDDHRWKMPVRIALVFVAFMKVPPSLARKPLRTHARTRPRTRTHTYSRTHAVTARDARMTRRYVALACRTA